MKNKYLIFLLLFAFLLIGCPNPPDPPNPPIPPAELVKVWVCADNQDFLSRPDCREGLLIEFKKGLEPTELCKIDHSPDIPIPEPSKPYVGTSFYQLQTESHDNIKWFIEQIHVHGGNMTEIFLVFTWSNGWEYSPFLQVGSWTEGDKWWDENHKFPTFDLNQWNPQTWETLKLIFSECKKWGIALSIRVHDYCSIKDGFEKRHNPFNNGSNIQIYTGGFWDEPIQEWYSKLNRKLIETINEAGLEHYFIVPMNEANVIVDEGDTEEWGDQVCLDYHQFMINDFKSLRVKAGQFILNIHRENTFEYFKDDYRMEIHGIASPESLAELYLNEGDNIFPNGDGATDGLGNRSFNNYTEPSFEQAVEMGKMEPEFYCYFERLTEQTEVADIRKAVFVALDGLVEGLKKQPDLFLSYH